MNKPKSSFRHDLVIFLSRLPVGTEVTTAYLRKAFPTIVPATVNNAVNAFVKYNKLTHVMTKKNGEKVYKTREKEFYPEAIHQKESDSCKKLKKFREKKALEIEMKKEGTLQNSIRVKIGELSAQKYNYEKGINRCNKQIEALQNTIIILNTA